ncbi:hypothetical protein CC117_29520 [Parafrankia colletiae]|uniref:Polysaccharide lyase 14 domain-containing protein n=1 Tax=Parafrankia colletiae TaxID=573497 RepID=A0A1S1Q265_9ACTN|nr:hypothetical protein [Parafrankia colletiae]MCK9903031.1 hypothetical protein [Frankia sp. Cpl3]OHV28993.1 hypothetical protein CC117_29520 [Parafrankia colletiae]
MSAPSRRAVAIVALLGAAGAGGCTSDGGRDGGRGREPAVRLATTAGPLPVAPHLQSFFGDELVIRRRGAFGLDDVAVRTPAPGCGWRSIRVRYPAGSASQLSVQEDGAPSGGAQAYLLFRGGPRDDLFLSYRVRFQSGFRFARGGKLPGLFGGTHVAGGHTPDGTNGFSTRYMWRDGGKGQIYAYLPLSRDYGTTLGLGTWEFVPGRWAAIQQRVRLNTPGRADGSVTVWVDGRGVFHQDGMLFRSTPALRIDGVFFSTFFGGDDLSWASPIDQYADFATFVVSDRFIEAGPAGTC